MALLIIILTFAFITMFVASGKPASNNKNIKDIVYQVGEKVGYSDKVIEDFKSKKEFYSRQVFQITNIYESEDFDMFGKGIVTRGVKVLKLNCGTVLYDFQAKKLPKDTPLLH